MKLVNEAEVRTIHPEVINEIGMNAAITMLGVARDLRDGTIPPDNFDMKIVEAKSSCGTVCCIAGWVSLRMKVDYMKLFTKHSSWIASRDGQNRLLNLFHGNNPSNPQLAADAIEKYVYDYAIAPWGKSFYR